MRTTKQIKETMDAQQTALPVLSQLTNTADTDIWVLFKGIVAQTINFFEQLMDRKKAEIETILNNAAVPSTEWARQKAYEFQYDATIPQIMQLVNFVPSYNPVDITKQIITRSFAYNSAGVTTLLVAKSEPPVKLSAGELTAIQGYYMNSGNGTSQAVGIGFAGQAISVYSIDPDLLFLEAEIKYNGQYAATIKNDTILAIETFISNVGAYPYLKITQLVDVMQKVSGFVDIKINNMSCRPDTTPFGSGTSLITAYAQSLTEYQITSGYMIGETTATKTLADKLTFTAV